MFIRMHHTVYGRSIPDVPTSTHTHTHTHTLTVYSLTFCPPSVRSVMFTRNADRLRAIALTLSMMGTGGTRWGHIDHS